MKLGKIDWCNKHQVIRAAEYLARTGEQQTVLFNGNNYCIIHTCNENKLIHGRMVVHRTG